MESPFHLVYAVGGRAPVATFNGDDSRSLAIEEARRLSALCPGQRFWVAEARLIRSVESTPIPPAFDAEETPTKADRVRR